jgi:hypothetical protein
MPRHKKQPRKSVEQTVQAIDRQLRALELRKAGASYKVIADALGYAHPSGAAQAVVAALKAVVREPAEEVRTLELERLDAALLAIWPAVRAGNFGAVDRVVRIMERRAKLLGLDRTVVSGMLDIDMTTLTDDQLQRLVDGEDPLAVLAGSRPRGE